MRVTLAIVLFLTHASIANAVQWEDDGYSFGNWVLWFGTSELDDSPAVQALIEDESSGNVLVVGCEEGSLYANYYFVNEDERISGDMIEVSFRFDKGNPEQMGWLPSASGDSALVEDDVALSFIMAANASDELYIRAFDNNIGNRDGRFLMIGIREVAYQIQNACSDESPSGQE